IICEVLEKRVEDVFYLCEMIEK
ncbi:transcriptional regulator, partial [Veillonellaceae bacterium M2-8]|nr:transcriptional regulator [Veillonellaceae bacterium M2-8]